MKAISQRDHCNYYSFLKDIKTKIEEKIFSFFIREIRGRFPDENYSFDVYLHSRSMKVYLVDFNPWSKMTDPLLFSWEELFSLQPLSSTKIVIENQELSIEEVQEKKIEFRIISSQTGIKPISFENRAPIEMFQNHLCLSEVIDSLKECDINQISQL